MKITKEQKELIKRIGENSVVWNPEIKKTFPKLFKQNKLNYLIKEAKRRGIVQGSCVFWADKNVIHRNINGLVYYDSSLDSLTFGGCIVYLKGTWPTLLKEVTEEELISIGLIVKK